MLAISACGSNQKYFDYAGKENVIPSEYKIRVKDVNVVLSEKKITLQNNPSASQYLDEKDLKERFKEEIENQLKRDGLYAEKTDDVNNFDSEFDINYTRSFMFLTDDKYAGSFIHGYKIAVYKNNQLVASRQDNEQYFVNKKFLGNWLKIIKTIFLAYDETDEKEEVDIFATAIAKDLKKLGQ